MDTLVYPRERTLGKLTLVLGLIAWTLLIVGTLGIALIYLLIGFIAYLFAHSAFIAHIKGTGVRLTPQQFPDLHARYLACCDKLGIAERPEAYVLHGEGWFNAFATRFLGRDFVILLSDVVDAMDGHPDGVNFYIGHELGHIRMKHLTGRLWRWPVLWLPLVGAAYARSQESTCDRHGAACCSRPEHAARAMAALAAGAKRWSTLDLEGYQQQVRETSGFWMSYHELTGGYPWLTKRIARVMGRDAELPRRHALAWVFACFVPNAGRASGAIGPLLLIAIIGVLAALAIPAYQDYQVRARLTGALAAAQPVQQALAAHYAEHGEVPASLEQAGVPARLADGSELALGEGMVVTVHTARGDLMLVPRRQDDGSIAWSCEGGEDVKPQQLPAACR